MDSTAGVRQCRRDLRRFGARAVAIPRRRRGRTRYVSVCPRTARAARGTGQRPRVRGMAKLKLPFAVFSTIASENREAFDRITLRPRALVPTLNLDVSVDLFGDPSWAPMVVGAMSDQKRFH